MAEIIDWSKYLPKAAETETVARQQHVERHTRPQPERERMPDWYERAQNDTRGMDGGAFSGRSWGGGRTR